jgi:DNA-directed RNA polymerase specialized sigma24 family protein
MRFQDHQERRSRTFITDGEPDLRRRVTEEVVDRLLERATCLPLTDRALLRAVYRDRQSTVELARLLGSAPRQVRRRLRRLVARVLSPEFIFVLRHRESWPRLRAEVATACILEGKSLRQAARDLDRSLTSVRSAHREVLAGFEMSFSGTGVPPAAPAAGHGWAGGGGAADRALEMRLAHGR